MSGYRRLTERENFSLQIAPWSVSFIPDLHPLGRPATARDVTRGNAVFHLAGKGKLAPLKLPAAGKMKAKNSDPISVLVVQAEIDSQGQTIYGVLQSGGVRRVAGDQLTDLKPIAESP